MIAVSLVMSTTAEINDSPWLGAISQSRCPRASWRSFISWNLCTTNKRPVTGDDQAKESVKKHDRVPIDELKGAELHSNLFFEMFTLSLRFWGHLRTFEKPS